MSAMMTQVELAEDVAACEAALELHDGFKSEIDSHIQSFRQFENRGHEIIKKGHFMTPEIQERLQDLNSSFESLLNLWSDKRTNLEHFLDFQLFKKKVKKLEAWLQGQEYNLAEEDGRSLEEVNYLIRKQEQLEEKLRLYEEKFEELRKTTKIEEELQSKSKDRTKSDETKLEEQRKEEFKRKEEERLLEERRKERAQFERQIPQAEISDDDLTPRNNLTESEQIFKRYDSKRSFQDRKQHQISTIPLPPVKPNTPAPPPTSAEGFLQRKQETFSGGKRSTSRTWKTYYTVLCGQLLCFFKDKKAFTQRNAAKAPINILGARCSLPKDYRKKKYVFRLEPTDNSSFLFEAPNDIKRDEWVQKINYTASLPPSMQLMMPADETDSMMNYRKDSTFSVSSEYRKWDDIEYDEPFEAKRNERVSFAEEPLYDDISHNIDQVSNPIYAIPHADIDSRSSTLSSYNDNLESARSSVSDQSYRTALASSTSTLQDEHYESSDDDVMYSMPEALSRTRSDMSVDAQEHERVQKYNSVPRNVGTTKPETKKRWSVFSLRRKH